MEQITTYFNFKKQEIIQFMKGIEKIIGNLSIQLQLAIDRQYDSVKNSLKNPGKDQLNSVFQQLQKQSQQRFQLYEQITKQIYAGVMELVQVSKRKRNLSKSSSEKPRQPNLEVSEVKQVYVQKPRTIQNLSQANQVIKYNQVYENPAVSSSNNNNVQYSEKKNSFDSSQKRVHISYQSNLAVQTRNQGDQYQTGQDLTHLNPMRSKSRLRDSSTPNKNNSGISITNRKIKDGQTGEKISKIQAQGQKEPGKLVQKWRSPLGRSLQKHQDQNSEQKRGSVFRSPSNPHKKYQNTFPITFENQFVEKDEYSYFQSPESVRMNPNNSFQQRSKVSNNGIKVTRNHQICQNLDQKIKNQAIEMLRKTQTQRTKSGKKVKGVSKNNMLPIHAISHFSPSAQAKERILGFERSSYFQ